MTTLSKDSLDFLAASTPEALAHVLAGQQYLRLRRLLYPQPRYRIFTIPKKDGTVREIAAPAKLLKSIQRRLANLLLEIYGDGKPSAHGYCKGRSIVTNSRAHVGKSFVFNLDLQEFFPSIHFGRVRGLFRSRPFSFPDNVASTLAHICCFQGRLPQGAPTSPILSNLICRSLDTDFQRLAKQFRATYTRYCDDITFSFTTHTARELPESIVMRSGGSFALGDILSNVLAKHSFKVNVNKNRLRGVSHRMEVTGLTVNVHPNVRREFVDQIRGMLHAWEKYGLVRARGGFPSRYRRKLHSGRIPSFENVLRGKLLYLKMVRGKEDLRYIRLAERFNSLVQKEPTTSACSATELLVSRRLRSDADLEHAVFLFESETSGGMPDKEGTAFFLGDGKIITCEHVVRRTDGPPVVYYNRSNGDRMYVSSSSFSGRVEVEIVQTFQEEDIAVLRPLTSLPSSVVPVALRANDLAVMEDVLVVGYPNHTPGKTLSRYRTQVVNHYTRFKRRHFEVAATVRPGMSGGPILDKNLLLVGVVQEHATFHSGNNGALSSVELETLMTSETRTQPSA